MVPVLKVAYGYKIFSTKSWLTVAYLQKANLIISGKFRKRFHW